MRGEFTACSLIALVLCTAGAQAQTEMPVPTVLDGVYSDAQALRGQASYGVWCSACHGNALEGVSAPELTAGSRFVERWREGPLDLLHSFLKERMPPRRAANATPIPDTDYLDILTYILKVNGYRAGPSELTLEHLANVMFVGLDGPRPTPDGALVITVGCLNSAGEGAWILSNAVEPARTRTSTTSTPAELSSSSQRSLGTLTFRLSDLEAVPDFNAAAHTGSRVQAKGYLVRQPNAARISLSAMDVLNSICE